MNFRKSLVVLSILVLLAIFAGLTYFSTRAEGDAQSGTPVAQTAEPTATITATATLEPTADDTKSDDVEYLYPEGFQIADEAVDLRGEVEVRDPADDLTLYECFPQDYSEGDAFNRGCAELQTANALPWSEPLAGYQFDYNDACRDNSRFCNIQIVTWNWVTTTGEEIFLPGVGSLRDPDGGAAMAIIMNAWEEPGEFEMAYIRHGFWATGQIWNMEDLTTSWDEDSETYVDNSYGAFSLETGATLRDHFLYQLMMTELFRGQCSRAKNCETVSYVIAIRWYDGSFHVVDSGQVGNPTP